MRQNDELHRILYEVQAMCSELNHKIDSIIRVMEIFTAYMQYSSMMSEFPFDTFVKKQEEGRENAMNPEDLQKMMNQVKHSNTQMSQDEFNQIFETLKQGKSKEETERMDQMVQMVKSFLK